MRIRLLSLLLAFVSVALAAIAVPAARNLARSAQQEVYLDRVNDTSWFAALAQQDRTRDDHAVLQSDLYRYDAVYGIAVAIINRDGTIGYASRIGLSASMPGMRGSLGTAMAGRPSENPSILWPWRARPMVVAIPIMRGAEVTGAAVTISPSAALHRNILVGWALIVVIAAAVLLLAVILSINLTRWILRPVYSLDAVTHTIATGYLDARVPKATGPPELRRLAASFNDMADHIQHAVDQQQMFVADASHQLRNPLSALLLRLEHLGTALPAGWEDELGKAREEGVRLTQVLDDLLVLAAAEHETLQQTVLDVATLVDERVDAWSAMAEHADVRLDRTGVNRAPSPADPAAIRGVLDVLISNAIKFSPPGARVEVALSAGGAPVGAVVGAAGGAYVVIEVRDEGTGLPEEELARIGDRFWRSAQHQNIAGSGLGIAIAKSLLASLGGRLELSANEPTGLVALAYLRSA